ncbi:hypothetical protein [Bdellovibrio svalbardensis]|uniref:Uncharacterized protein n=1 Tax=Bdellovibrio svalbardensis TaxID=2972972 RepID=A0ABT6DGI1_9BACT|nr:hypothetical protein [Bdellovibrio svalbardensis]MDG0815931.1 hypothetical protein [Bdellovibrio svalbardensis]
MFLGYRSFFGNKSAGGEHGVGGSLDTAQLEKTLQKILDAQGTAAKHTGAHHEDASMDIDVAGMSEKSASAVSAGAAGGAVSADVEKLRSVVSENQKTIEVLQSQLAEAKAQAASAQAGAPAAADSGMSSAEKEDLSGKIRDLESRLAEYEIISEDIADLSRYKDENEALRAELEALQKAAAAAPAAAPVAPVVAEAAPAPEPVSTPEPEPTPVAEPVVEAAASTEDMVDAALAEAAAQMAPEPAPAEAPGADLIDDELMKEFAAAVEGQKTISKVGEKAGSGKVAADKKTDENEQLMNEFENFVSKKS